MKQFADVLRQERVKHHGHGNLACTEILVCPKETCTNPTLSVGQNNANRVRFLCKNPSCQATFSCNKLPQYNKWLASGKDVDKAFKRKAANTAQLPNSNAKGKEPAVPKRQSVLPFTESSVDMPKWDDTESESSQTVPRSLDSDDQEMIEVLMWHGEDGYGTEQDTQPLGIEQANLLNVQNSASTSGTLAAPKAAETRLSVVTPPPSLLRVPPQLQSQRPPPLVVDVDDLDLFLSDGDIIDDSADFLDDQTTAVASKAAALADPPSSSGITVFTMKRPWSLLSRFSRTMSARMLSRLRPS